jgi:hypothetical protein
MRLFIRLGTKNRTGGNPLEFKILKRYCYPVPQMKRAALKLQTAGGILAQANKFQKGYLDESSNRNHGLCPK